MKKPRTFIPPVSPDVMKDITLASKGELKPTAGGYMDEIHNATERGRRIIASLADEREKDQFLKKGSVPPWATEAGR